MRSIAIVHSGKNTRLELSETDMPSQPGEDQVLIEVAAAGVNRPDLMQRQGKYPPPAGASHILGLEVAGIIIACGNNVTAFKSGDAVCALITGGGYAQYCLAYAVCCLPIPKNFSFEQAAALPETYFTVWDNVFERGQLSSGEKLLVHGGGSGIGTTAIQFSKAFGNTVFTTAGTELKCHKCCEIGADAAINYRKNDFVESIEHLTEGKGVNLVLDMIGGDYFPRNLKCLADEGRLVQIATQNGIKTEINLWQIMLKRLTITGSTLRARDHHFKSKIACQLHEKIWPLLEAGTIKPIIDSVFPLEDAEKAHVHMLNNQHFGKIVLKILPA